jgi:hypothetical protein
LALTFISVAPCFFDQSALPDQSASGALSAGALSIWYNALF